MFQDSLVSGLDYQSDSSAFDTEYTSPTMDDDHSSNLIFMQHPEEMLKPWIAHPMFTNIVITHSVTFLFGLVGNIIVVIVMVNDRKSRNATNMFLVSLAVADLLLLLVYTPLETLQYFLMPWDESGAVCKLAMYALTLSAMTSVLNLLAVTLERFIVIVFPIKSRSLCTISNCKKTILAAWCLSSLLTIPVLFTKETYPMVYTNNQTNVTLHYCNETQQSAAFAIYQFIVMFVAPCTLMVVCYTYVIRVLWRSTRNMQVLTNNVSMKKLKTQNGPNVVASGDLDSGGSTRYRFTHLIRDAKRYKGEDVRKARKQVIKMLILVILLFFTCWGLRFSMDLIIKLNLRPFTQTIFTLRVIFNLLPVVHACMNPFIYSFMSKNFRLSFKRQLEKFGRKKRNQNGNSNSATGIGSSSRTSRYQLGTPTMQRSLEGLRLKSARTSTSSSPANYMPDITNELDSPVWMPSSATSYV